MIVYLLSDENGYQWLVVGIFTTKELAEEKRQEIISSYLWDASQYYKIHEIELDKELVEDYVGLII